MLISYVISLYSALRFMTNLKYFKLFLLVYLIISSYFVNALSISL